MTKYILAGAADREYTEFGTRLSVEVNKTINGPVRLLSYAFATPRETWEVTFTNRLRWFKSHFGGNGQYHLAFLRIFTEQIKAADIIYLHRGDDELLEYRMSHFKDFIHLVKDKIVIGSSAGADWLSDVYWTCDWRTIRRGSGITGLNIIPHYDSDSYGLQDPRGPINWQNALAELQQAVGSESVIMLKEGEFVVIEK